MKHLIALLLLVSVSFAQNNTGTLVIAPIRPQAANDTFPSAIANEIKGGPFSVSNVAAMSNIPSERLVAGALAYVTNDNSFRLYNGESWSQSGVRDAIGLGWSALTNTNAATSLLGYTTNGQVVANTGTNVLTFTNTISIQGGTRITESGVYYGPDNTQFGFNFEESKIVSISNNAIVDFGDGNNISANWPITFSTTNIAASTRSNLGFSTNLNTLWTSTTTSNARSALGLGETNRAIFGSTLATNYLLGTNSNNAALFTVLNPDDWSGLNVVAIQFPQGSNRIILSEYGATFNGTVNFNNEVSFSSALTFYGDGAGLSRTNLGLKWSGLTNTNSYSMRADLGFRFELDNLWDATSVSNARWALGLSASWLTNTNASNFREAIGLGATNTVTFGNIANNGNFTNNNGTIYGLKTNVGPFEGIGNFFASNNTTVGNETLFRVGVAENTNKSAQFGFRVARTNNGGEGLAVFSVFGYNALMMIGPSDRSRSNSLTNTNAAIEADIWTMSESDRVMTLKDTNTGAMVMHRPIGFNTNNSAVLTSAPANTNVTNPNGWIQFYVGTNSVRVPYYQ